MNYRWMTERDVEIVMEVHRRRVLSIRQLADLFCYGMRSGRDIMYQRVRKLVGAKMLREIWMARRKYVMLGAGGEVLVASRLRIDRKELKGKVRGQQTVQNIEHYELTNDVGILLARHGDVDFYVGPRYDLGSTFCSPDALGTFTRKRVFDFYLEADRGTQSPKTFRKKVSRYEELLRSGKYKQDFERFPYVLVITSAGEGRILALAEAILAAKKTPITFMLADFEAFSRDPLGEVFFVPGRDRRYSVLAGGRPL